MLIKLMFYCLGAGLLAGLLYWGYGWWLVLQAKDYPSMLKALYSHSIPTVNPTYLNESRQNWVVLDARAETEYEVSHITGATWVNYPLDLKLLPKDLQKTDSIVVYCSVGYRSERVAEQLEKAGYTNVWNLYGGLFEWANQEQPLYTSDSISTARIHGYSPSWGKWIDNKADLQVVYD